MTTLLDIALGVVKKPGKPLPPAIYGKYLERLAKAANLDKHALADLTGLDANTIYRNFAGRPERSILSMNNGLHRRHAAREPRPVY